MPRRFVRRLWNLFGYDADFWRGPMLLGLMLAAVTWTVWYFTKAPCIGDNAANGLCNDSLLASFINVDILSRCTAAWLGATTLTGGINAIMLERERQRTNEVQQQLMEERKRSDEERKRFDEERKRYEERIDDLINENRAERQQMMAMFAELLAAQRQQNGNGANEQP